jgi:hypothetical protein
VERRADSNRDHAVSDRQFSLFEAREDHWARIVDERVDTTETGNSELMMR